MIVHNKHAEPWKVTVVDTGLNTQTGGRVKRIREYIGNEPFMLTYGDAVGDVNIGLEEDFEQNATLNPGITVNKDVKINNEGPNTAYVWYTYTVPEALVP